MSGNFVVESATERDWTNGEHECGTGKPSQDWEQNDVLALVESLLGYSIESVNELHGASGATAEWARGLNDILGYTVIDVQEAAQSRLAVLRKRAGHRLETTPSDDPVSAAEQSATTQALYETQAAILLRNEDG